SNLQELANDTYSTFERLSHETIRMTLTKGYQQIWRQTKTDLLSGFMNVDPDVLKSHGYQVATRIQHGYPAPVMSEVEFPPFLRVLLDACVVARKKGIAVGDEVHIPDILSFEERQAQQAQTELFDEENLIHSQEPKTTIETADKRLEGILQ